LKDITVQTLAKFRDVLLASRGLKPHRRASPNTVRSKMVLIQGVLDRAGPAGPNRRDAAGIIQTVPWVKPPRARVTQPKIVPPQHIEATYKAFVLADRPRLPGIKPPAWWRALFVTAYFTGLRRGTLFSLRLDHIDWNARSLDIPAENMKSNRPHAIPLVETVLDHLRVIRTDRELVFPWPQHLRTFHLYFHVLQNWAGIPKEEYFGLHALRRTLATNLTEVGSVDVARFMLGHVAADVTERHYINPDGIVANAIRKVPVPEAFKSKRGPTSTCGRGRKVTPARGSGIAMDPDTEDQSS